MSISKIYNAFLGDWDLIVSQSHYGQGEAPAAGAYKIREDHEGLEFVIEWQEQSGESHSFSFVGVPDGKPHPFSGDDLIDSMSVSAPSDAELTSEAFYKGRKLMEAKRVLRENGAVMEITQSVVLPDGSQPANITRYRRKLHS